MLSRSTSYRPSVDHHRAGSHADPSHFEDITLKDEREDADDFAFGRASATATASTSGARKGSTLPPPSRFPGPRFHRPSTSTGHSWNRPAESRRPSFPTLKEQFQGIAAARGDSRYPSFAPSLAPVPGSGGGGGGGLGRRLVSPSTTSPSFQGAGPSLVRSLSSSPTRDGRRKKTPNGGPPPPPRRGSYAPPTAARENPRRSSWQPNRKTVQELEAEYHDSDDDVPDDAVFWNVPISPKPLAEGSTSVAEPLTPALMSPTGIPQRRSSLPDAAATDVARAGPRSVSPSSSLSPSHAHAQAHPRSVSQQRSTSLTLASPKNPGLARATTMPTSISARRQQSLRNSRTLTWNTVMDELSEETRDLTQALQAHAERQQMLDHDGQVKEKPGQAESGRTKVGSRPPSSTAATAQVELPPVQKTGVVEDPLPISKEKEAVLTRTRPSWLPPKSKEEEKRHLREYQRMMARSLELDRRRAERDEEHRRRRDEVKISILHLWQDHVLPNWDRGALAEPRTRELWWRGIPPKMRGLVWQRAVRNDLELTENSYKAALKRARDAEKQLLGGGGGGGGGGGDDADRHPDAATATDGQTHTHAHADAHAQEYRRREHDWFDAIRRDAKTTFPELRIFQPGGPLHQALVDLLMAYSMYRSDVGYIYGTNTIAALLLLNLGPAQAFVLLSNLLNNSIPLAFLTNDPSAVSQTYEITLRTLAYKFPGIYQHLTRSSSVPGMSASPSSSSFLVGPSPTNGSRSPTTQARSNSPNPLGRPSTATTTARSPSPSPSAHPSPESYLEPMFRSLFTKILPIDHASRVWDVYVFEGDRALIRAAVAIIGKVLHRYQDLPFPGPSSSSSYPQHQQAGHSHPGPQGLNPTPSGHTHTHTHVTPSPAVELEKKLSWQATATAEAEAAAAAAAGTTTITTPLPSWSSLSSSASSSLASAPPPPPPPPVFSALTVKDLGNEDNFIIAVRSAGKESSTRNGNGLGGGWTNSGGDRGRLGGGGGDVRMGVGGDGRSDGRSGGEAGGSNTGPGRTD